MILKDRESPNKDKEHHKSNARRKYERINISLSDSCSAGVRVKIISLFNKMN